jgi:hypothetical protein
MTTLSIHELTAESAELLPTRETLFFVSVDIAHVTAVNSAAAVNFATVFSAAQAVAGQTVTVIQ